VIGTLGAGEGQHSGPHTCEAATLPLKPAFFCVGYFQIGAPELFAQDGP
jgi:hypothetical protein